MALYHGTLDPYSSGENHYECRSCGHRSRGESSRSSCPECGGQVRNISVPRE